MIICCGVVLFCSTLFDVLEAFCIWMGISFCFVFLFHSFFLRFSISWATSSVILSVVTLNLLISLFMVFSVSVWYLFKALMHSLICFCVFSYSLFSWVPPIHFGWPCLVTSVWNSYWLLAEFLFSECSCGLCWLPWLVYLCFVGVWIWVSILFISHWILY
jgi:hypothetical protein